MQIKKFVATGLAALMTGATLAGAALAATQLGNVLNTIGQQAVSGTPYLVVVGSKADPSDVVGAIDVASALAQKMTTEETIETTIVEQLTGGISLDTTNTKLYLNDHIDAAKGVLTDDNLDILADGTAEDNSGETYTYHQYLYIGGTSENDGPQIKYDQPNDEQEEPIIHIDLSTSTSSPIYTLKVVFDEEYPVNESIGKKLTLFGKEFTISHESTIGSSTKKLVLFESSEKVVVNAGEETTVTIDGVEHTIKVVGITDQDTAVVSINGETREVDEGNSYTIGGVEVYIDDVYYYEIPEKTGSVKISLGTNKVIFENNKAVKIGDDYIKNTLVTISGSNNKLSTLEIKVAAQDSDEAYVSEDTSYTDPIFGTFKLVFGGMDSTETETIKVEAASEKTYKVTFTDRTGESASIEWAYEDNPTASSTDPELKDSDGNSYVVVEGEALSENDYTILTGGGFYRLIQITDVDTTNSDSSTAEKGTVTIKDVITGAEYEVSVDETGSNDDIWQGTKVIDGQTYYFYVDTNDKVHITWGSGANYNDAGNEVVVYPVLETSKGAKIALTKELFTSSYTVGTVSADGGSVTVHFVLPTGDLYFNVTDPDIDNASDGSIYYSTDGSTWTSMTSGSETTVTVGSVSYKFTPTKTGDTTSSPAGLTISNFYIGALSSDKNPALLIVEEKDKDGNENAIIVESDTDISNDYIDLATVDMTDSNAVESEPTGDTYTTKYFDTYGVQMTKYDREQASLTITYPDNQLVAKVAIGENPTWTTTTGGGETYKKIVPLTTTVARLDTEVTEAEKTNDNLILVGGPCVNDLVAELANAGKFPYTCDNWPARNFGLIKAVDDAFTSGKLALVVAGTRAEDTRLATSVLALGKLAGHTESAVEVTGTTASPVITPA